MIKAINIYCDESCHLANDNSEVMALGAVWCPFSKRKEIFERIREIKVQNGFKPSFEIKWNKISPSGIHFYMDILDYFFDDDDLHFRGLVVPNKKKLDHAAYKRNHDDFYYVMWFDLLKVILSPEYSHNIFIDIKDTKSQSKVDELKKILATNHYDYRNRIIDKIQQVHSHEVEILQITDLLTGALSYFHRGLEGSKAKRQIIERIKRRSGYSLTQNTLYKEDKFNLFIWKSR